MSTQFFESFCDMIAAELESPIYHHPASLSNFLTRLDAQIAANSLNGNLLPSEAAFLRVMALRERVRYEQQVNN